MTDTAHDPLHERLERLERELGWWRRAGVALLAGVGLLGAVAATVRTNPDEVKTQRLVIVDRDGRTRAVFTVDDGDRTRLTLADRDNATTADITVIPGQSAALSLTRATAQAQLAAAGDNGQLSVGTSGQRGWLVAAPGGSSVGLGNESGKPQISLVTSPTLPPSLLLADRDGNAVWKAP